MSQVRVRILQLGRRVISHQAEDGATLERLLAEVGLSPAPVGVDVRVNGETAVAERVLIDGDVVTLIPRIKGGCGADGGAHHTHAVARNGPPQLELDLAVAARAIAAQEEIRCHHVGFVGYGATAPGQRVLLAVDSHYDPAVLDAFRDALRERGAHVDTLVLDAGEDRPFEYVDEIRVVMRRAPRREAPRRWEGVPWVEEFADQLINRKTWELIWSHGRGGRERITNPEGTDFSYTLHENYYDGSRRGFTDNPVRSYSHLLGHPPPPFLPAEDASGVCAGTTSHYTRAFPQVRLRLEQGCVTSIEGGDRHGAEWANLLFPTFAVTSRQGETRYLINNGRLCALDDPEVRDLAARFGDPDELLREDWIPSIPGVSAGGEYADYARDPAPWIYARG